LRAVVRATALLVLFSADTPRSILINRVKQIRDINPTRDLHGNAFCEYSHSVSGSFASPTAGGNDRVSVVTANNTYINRLRSSDPLAKHGTTLSADNAAPYYTTTRGSLIPITSRYHVVVGPAKRRVPDVSRSRLFVLLHATGMIS